MKCSVLVLAYNQEKYIRQCLEGILKQRSNFDFELIIGEDYSTDSTRNICQEYAKKKNIVRLLSSPEERNLGYTNNWRRIINEGSGEYIAICEGDDYWTDVFKLQKQIDYLDANPRCALCYTDCDIYYENEKKWEHAIFANGNALMNHENILLGYGYRGNLTWVIRREILTSIIIPDKCSDVPLYLLYEIFLRAEIGFIRDVTGVFRRHTGSLSNNAKDIKKDFLYHKNHLLMRLNYAAFMPNPNYTRKICYWDILPLYEPATELGDEELLSVLHNYYKIHMEELFEFLTLQSRAISEKENEIISIRKSKKYRIGAFLIQPFSIIIKYFKTCFQ